MLYRYNALWVWIMNQSEIFALAIAFSSIMIISGTNICDNAHCEPQINASLGMEFAISFESTPLTGHEWWTKFDPNYLSLMNRPLSVGMIGIGRCSRKGGVLPSMQEAQAIQY